MTNNKLEQLRLNFSRFANHDVNKAPLSSNNTCKTDRILIFFLLLFVDWSRWRKSFTSLLALLRLLKISTFRKSLPLRSTSIGHLRERYCISHLVVNSYPSRCFWVGVWLHSLFTCSQFSYDGLRIQFLLWWLLGLHCFAMKYQFLLRLVFFGSKLVIFPSVSVILICFVFLMFSPWKFNFSRWLQWECFPLWQLFASTCWAGRGMEFLLWHSIVINKSITHTFPVQYDFFLISYSGCI